MIHFEDIVDNHFLDDYYLYNQMVQELLENDKMVLVQLFELLLLLMMMMDLVNYDLYSLMNLNYYFVD